MVGIDSRCVDLVQQTLVYVSCTTVCKIVFRGIFGRSRFTSHQNHVAVGHVHGVRRAGQVEQSLIVCIAL